MKQKIIVLCAMREDNVIRSLIQEMEGIGPCIFYVVPNGAQALRMAQNMTPDILVTDSVLPGLDGPALVDRLRETMGMKMPRIIGGAMMPFAQEALLRHGVKCIVSVPWEKEELKNALLLMIADLEKTVDWVQAEKGFSSAHELLETLGMHSTLNGCVYLAWAAALVAQSHSRLYAIGERVYAPIAEKYATNPQNVERLIRHAVESTMDTARSQALYAFFGNTIDPMRGKPTNAQMISMLAQKISAGGK